MRKVMDAAVGRKVLAVPPRVDMALHCTDVDARRDLRFAPVVRAVLGRAVGERRREERVSRWGYQLQRELLRSERRLGIVVGITTHVELAPVV